MKFTLPALASLLALAPALALATPPYPTNATTNGTITPPSRYYLQTQVKGYGNPDKNGLFVSGYHTGAGMNDAVLTQSIDVAAAGYLNGTSQQFDLGNPFPWGMSMVEYDFYAEWEFVAINAGDSESGFFFNESGLQWGEYTGGYSGEFGGWLACDWWHGIPQLFMRVGFYQTASFPSSCAQVDLMPVAILE